MDEDADGGDESFWESDSFLKDLDRAEEQALQRSNSLQEVEERLKRTSATVDAVTSPSVPINRCQDVIAEPSSGFVDRSCVDHTPPSVLPPNPQPPTLGVGSNGSHQGTAGRGSSFLQRSFERVPYQRSYQYGFSSSRQDALIAAAIEELNPQQKAAVLMQPDSPLLIIAGPGCCPR